MLGCYYLTRERPSRAGEGMKFAPATRCAPATTPATSTCRRAIEVRIDGKLEETTVGPVLLFDIVPRGMPFELVNRVMDKKTLGELVNEVYRRVGNKATVLLSDRLRTLGYEFATRAGISICIDDMRVPETRQR